MKLFIIFNDYAERLFYYNLWKKNPIVTITTPTTTKDRIDTTVPKNNSS